jgi:starch-binding outer membrane protein, SusD/RagB family
VYSMAGTWQNNFSTTNESSTENIFVVAHAPLPDLGMSIQMRGLHYNQLVPAPWNGFATLAETYRAFSPADARRNIFLIGQQFSYNTGAAVNDRNNNPLVFTDTINNVEAASEAEGARLMKFPPLAGAPDGNSHPNDFPYFRLAEMYLIRAEARNETGDQVNAIADLNQVRARHFSPPQPIVGALTQAQVRAAILRERLFELAGEAKRRSDLIRFGQFTATRRICQAAIAGCVKPARADHIVLMPIPQTQIQNNPRLSQNPGY